MLLVVAKRTLFFLLLLFLFDRGEGGVGRRSVSSGEGELMFPGGPEAVAGESAYGDYDYAFEG